MALNVDQWAIGGLTVGDGTVWRVLNVPSGLAHDEVRADPSLLPRGHGGVDPDEEFAGFRTWELDLLTHDPDPSVVWSRWADLAGRLQPSTDVELTFRRPGESDRLSPCRTRAPVPVFEVGQTILRVRVRLHASDPVLYSATLHSVPLEPHVGVGFASYPADPSPSDLTFGSYPKLYTGGGSGGGVTVDNGGDWPVWPRFVIGGPSSGSVNVEKLENVTTGEAMQFTDDGGLSVPAGQTLIVETHPARRLVRFESGADRLNTIVDLDSWWQLAPGSQELRFRASGDVGGVSCDVTFRDGWLH